VKQPIFKLLCRLWLNISARRRGQMVLLLVLMILVSFAEILSIGAMLPFLAILTDPERVFVHPDLQPIIQILQLTEPKQLLLPLTCAFGLTALIAGIMRLILLWASIRLSYASGTELSISIYQRTLYQPYAVHAGRNSSEIIDGISNKTGNAIFIINMSLNLISSSVMLATILVALLNIDSIVAISAFGGFGLIYFIIIKLNRNRLLLNSQTVARQSTYVVKCLQEGLGGIRDVLIDGSQAAYCKIYRNADQPLRLAQGNSLFISSSPRYVVEALGIVLMAGLAYALAQRPNGIAEAIPILGAFALGAQRLLPELQRAYSSWAIIQGGQVSLQDTLDLLEQPLPDYAENVPVKLIPFRKEISLKKVSFRYGPQTPWVLSNLNLTIPKGSRIGFIGVTGTGKSTLLDIVMGLLQPNGGELAIDGEVINSANLRAWQANIAHVPQTIFLVDSTIEENIAFGVPKTQINRKLVQQAAKQAQIAEIIDSWPEGFQTLVGERGIRLSGGQRQRIGIARALYKQAEVIIFDEATSSLDNETEQAVMYAIEGLRSDLTLLMVAHRLTTLSKCSQIVELSDGEIKRVGTFQEIMNQSSVSPRK
jgi:ABC-type bacteriocin/lantibiotic exporter with double-glycine peptidase domain